MFRLFCFGLCLLGLVMPIQASLIIGFEFSPGVTKQVVPAAGGTYVVNVVASTDNATTTNLALNAGYFGALSQALNGSTLGGNITANSVIPALLNTGSNLGTLGDRNTDGHIDLGMTDGITKGDTNWVRPNAGGTPTLLGSARAIIGTFTITIPGNVGNGLDFLSFIPQLNPSGAGNDWSWSETNVASPFISGGVGLANPVVAGSSVTFATVSAIPEPGTYALGGIILAGLAGLKLRRKKA
jgi:hypothetical protein